MRLLCSVLLVVVLGAGCATSGREDSVPAAASPADRAGAPTISEPRQLALRADDPCGTLLTPTQLRSLGFGRAGAPSIDSSSSPTCTWRSGGDGSRTVTASVVQNGDLFVDTYRTRPFPIFRPHEVLGLPAVDSKVVEDDAACTTTVGVADGQTLDVDVARGTFGDESEADSCAISRRVAEEIVSTLPPLPR